MASEALKRFVIDDYVKTIDLSFTYPSGGSSNVYQTIPFSRDRVIALILRYTDDVFFNPISYFLRRDNDNVGIKPLSIPSADRKYVITVVYI